MKLKLLIIVFIPFLLFAQSSTSYSRYGIGDVEYSFSTRSAALGNLNAAYNDGLHLTTLNPASWNTLTRTRLEVSSKFNTIFLSNSTSSNYFGNAEFTGFAFGFPVSQAYGIGAVMGLVPYSNVSYDIKETSITSNNIEYISRYEGRGGLSKVFIGTSYRTPFGVNLGATFDYYFGNIEYLSTISFSSSEQLKTEYKKTYDPKGFGTTIGLITPNLSKYFKSESITDVRIGLAAAIVGNLATDTMLTKRSSVAYDTLSIGAVDMKVPLRLNAGLNVIFSEKYLVSLDYAFQPWSKYTFNGAASGNLRDAQKVSAGFEYKPVKGLGASFWEQIVWRLGLSFEQTQYLVNGTGIDQFSVSGGFGMPMGDENSLDISIQYSMRGTTESNLFKENRIALNLGFSLGEVWFLRHDK
ncbi:MAG: hypothetical protein K8H86_09160 [Ignavibacteriaceae bacterium]|nr:hypothetical protein [Ignavibacteriaceae bacterium]